MAESDAQELFFDNDGSGCFGCSRSNPHGLQLRFHRRGDAVVSHYTIPDRFHGAPEVAHGGIVATLLDEVSCAAVHHLAGTWVVTGELSVRYEKPCPVEMPLLIEATLRERRPRYWIVDAKVERDGELLARSEGRFFPVEGPSDRP
jgi:acyl-coenzyme A thioesterase PaaI-like protein